MSLLKLPFVLGLGALAALAVAQETSPPAPEPQPKLGLSGLEEMVNELEDQPTQAPAPAPPPANPPATRPTTAPPAAVPTPVRASPPPASPTSPLREQVDAVSERGRQLIAFARAGIIATQDMLSRVANPTQTGIDGWVAEPEGNSMTVTFFADGNDGPVTVYRVNVLGPRVVSRDAFLGTYRPPLSRSQARLAAARRATVALAHRPCGTLPFNTLVVPSPGAGAPIEVYQISPPSQAGRFPLGGHFRTTVSSDGEVIRSRPLGEGCTEFQVVAPPQGQQPRPIPVSHGLDPVPNEIHVFLSQNAVRALLVTAGEPPRQWLVAGERISEVRDGAVQPR